MEMLVHWAERNRYSEAQPVVLDRAECEISPLVWPEGLNDCNGSVKGILEAEVAMT
jgi:hypothetical protein